MKLTMQKRLAGSIMDCSPKRVWFDNEKLSDIKEAITKADLKSLIYKGVVQEKPAKSNSRSRARKIQAQKKKGKKKGHGRRKGVKTARSPKKKIWMNTVRLQRKFLKELKEKGHLESKAYRELYLKSKGGYFRSKRHLQLYIEEKGMFAKSTKGKKA
jgi:large subunit ribosomal protein L19e